MRSLGSLLLLAMLAGCAAKEQLTAKNAAVPTGVDLTGLWQLEMENQGKVQPGFSRNGALVQVFLETGKSLKLTQTDFGLFISFDRSVVEEYRFGEQRTIHVGPVEAQRVSGWEGNSYVIETLDEEGAKLDDRYSLNAAATQLLRTFRVLHRDVVQLEVEQRFERSQ